MQVARRTTAGAAVMALLAWAAWQLLLLVLVTVISPSSPHLACHDSVGQITRAPLEAAQQQHAKLSCVAQHLQGPGIACCAHSMLPVHAAGTCRAGHMAPASPLPPSWARQSARCPPVAHGIGGSRC